MKQQYFHLKFKTLFFDKRKIFRTNIKFLDKIKYIKYLFNYTSQLYLWFPIFPFVIIKILVNDYGNLKMINRNLIIKKPHKGILLYEKLRTKKYAYFKNILKFFILIFIK